MLCKPMLLITAVSMICSATWAAEIPPGAAPEVVASVAANEIAKKVDESRNPKKVREFRKNNPCPTTGLIKGACPNQIVDHEKPLCAWGADDPTNMNWQDKLASYIKDDEERKLCRFIKKAGIKSPDQVNLCVVAEFGKLSAMKKAFCDTGKS